MKIYIIPISEKLQPAASPFRYPSYNDDYGVEQDFYKYLTNAKDILTNEPSEADWHYLPIYWTRWHLNHDYARQGIPELQSEVDNVLLDYQKTFTVCQYDDGPVASLGNTIVFLSSRKSDVGVDIPLLASKIPSPFFVPRKKFLASFVGRLSTHVIRQDLFASLKGESTIYFFDGDAGTKFYVRTLLKSHLALCPRGYGGSSFRFFEAMQLGVVPVLIGDLDTRPFKNFLPWNDMSFYVREPEDVKSIFNDVSQRDIEQMSKFAQKMYCENLAYQKWCKYVLLELEEIKRHDR